MAYKPYTLYKRPATKPGTFTYYVQFRDPNTGKRLAGRSTGQTTKAAAHTWATDQLRKGIITDKNNISFEAFVKDWWKWDRCSYIKKQLARGVSLSKGYCEGNRRNLQKYILPYFGKIKLRKLGPAIVEDFMMELREKPVNNGKCLSAKTVNNIINTLSVMLKEAHRLQYIPENPAANIGKLAEKPRSRSFLSKRELVSLFSESAIGNVWNSNLKHFTLNLLAASTAMRMGECQGLQIKNVHDSYVAITTAWKRQYGLEAPKNNSKRLIPIPTKTSQCLQKLIAEGPYSEDPDSFVFYGKNGSTPVDHKTITQQLHSAFVAIGITEEERRHRNITFHSWRHMVNSLFRNRIPDSKLRRIIGHRTPEMTENYTHFQLEDYSDVRQLQETLFA